MRNLHDLLPRPKKAGAEPQSIGVASTRMEKATEPPVDSTELIEFVGEQLKTHIQTALRSLEVFETSTYFWEIRKLVVPSTLSPEPVHSGPKNTA